MKNSKNVTRIQMGRIHSLCNFIMSNNYLGGYTLPEATSLRLSSLAEVNELCHYCGAHLMAI